MEKIQIIGIIVMLLSGSGLILFNFNVIAGEIGGITYGAQNIFGLEQSIPIHTKIDENLLSKSGNIDVLIEFSAPTGMMAVNQQGGYMAQLQNMGIQVTHQFYDLVNAIECTISSNELSDIAKIPGVKKIYSNDRMVQVVDVPQILLLTDSVPLINVGSLWNQGFDGDGVVVAVVDSGIYENHPAFLVNGNSIVIARYSIDGREYSLSHGTHCAGIIASNDLRYRGVSPGVRLLNVHVLPNGQGRPSDVIKGFSWIASWKDSRNAQVVASCSFGASPHDTGCGGWRNPCLLCRSVNNLASRGVVVVVASGNSDNIRSRGYSLTCPGQAQKAFTVGAVTKNLEIAGYSSIGPTVDGNKKPDVCAPGSDITSSVPTGWEMLSGTSMSTPHVAGLVAVLMEAKPGYNEKSYRDAIKNGAVDKGQPGWDIQYGYGIADGERAVDSIGVVSETNFNIGLIGFSFIGIVLIVYPRWKK